MSDVKVQKIKLLKIWEILNRKTDELHPISTQGLIQELALLGIKCERRTIYADIDSMQHFGYGICNKRKGHDMVYWVKQRQFDLPEIKIIMDAIQSSKFIPKKMTEELLNKLADLGGSSRTELMKRNVIHFNAVKHSNAAIYEIVDSLERAIENKKKITFNYFLLNFKGQREYKHNNKLYCEEPLGMINDDGNYYLICYRSDEGYDNNIKTFRIDRIDNISVLDDSISKEGVKVLNKIMNYPKQAFKMFGGPVRKVSLQFDEELIGVIFNKFGEDTFIKQENGKCISTVNVQVSPTFWGWLLQFPTSMKIIAPDEMKEQYRQWLMSGLEDI